MGHDGLPDPDAINELSGEAARALLRQLVDLLKSLNSTVDQLQQRIAEMQRENAELKRMLFGKKSEKLPPIGKVLRERRSAKDIDPDQRRRAARERRRKNAQAKKELPTEPVVHEVPADALRCPK